MSAVDMVAPAVHVGGAPLAADVLERLVHVRVELGVCVVGRATLRFRDTGYQLAAGKGFALGIDVQVFAGAQRIFSGVVTGIGVEQLPDQAPELVVTADDRGFLLGRTMEPETYLEMSYADVVKKVVGGAGLKANVAASIGSDSTYEHLMRTGSPLSVVDRIAQLTATVWWVDDKTFHMQSAKTPVGAVQATLGDDLIEWSVRASALRPTEVQVTGWNPDKQEQVVGKQSGAKGPNAKLVQSYLGDNPNRLARARTVTANLPSVTPREAGVLARAVLDGSTAGAVIARGMCYATKATAGLAPMAAFTVSGSGPADGTYTVTEVEYKYAPHGFFVRFVAGPLRPTNLVDTIGREAPEPGFLHHGLMIGVVTNNNDSQGGYGRVKVKFAGLGELESAWARVATPGGGSGRGITFQYEVGDEVLVGFENGDTRRPVVLGGLFSKKNVLPDAKQVMDGADVGYRRIKTRKGHVLEFADSRVTEANYALLKLAQPAHQLKLGGDAFLLEVGDGIPVTIKAGQSSIEISQAGDITIKGQNITVQAQQKLALKGMQVDIEAQGALSMKGAMVAVKGSGTADVEASGMLTLKGGLVKIN